MLFYSAVGVIIIVLACVFDALVSIAGTFVAYPLVKAITGRIECDKNIGKLMEKADAVGNSYNTQEILEFQAKRELESERQR